MLTTIQKHPDLVPREASLTKQRTSLIMKDIQLMGENNISDNRYLELTNALQSTLEIDKLLEIFNKELGTYINHDGLLYLNRREHLEVFLGKKKLNKLNYNLVLFEKKLGQLTIYRASSFTEEEIHSLETLLAAIIYPLRNTILYKQAVEKAYRDPTTGLNNRLAFETALEQEMDFSQRHEMLLTLIMLDIDHFKQINDKFGHIAGDKVLACLAECMEECIRRSDILYRYGGEEFSILLRNTDLPGAILLAERLRQAVEKMVCLHDSIPIKITISLGIATLEKNENKTSLIKRADIALYKAKATGRNQLIV